MFDAAKVMRGKHFGETAWIVGLGASIKYLTAEPFDSGPIITLNSAIKIVQDLGLPNKIYSLQKDGCEKRDLPGHQCAEGMIYPRNDIPVILPRRGYGELCLNEHPNRLWLDYVKSLDLRPPEMSVRIAVALALSVMGCTRIAFVCCDSLLGDKPGNLRRYYPETSKVALPPAYGNYIRVRPLVLKDVRRVPHFYVTPKKGRVDKVPKSLPIAGEIVGISDCLLNREAERT
ncbi:MAG: hypothetical protein WD740_00680 [Anaerolineales bacterium]